MASSSLLIPCFLAVASIFAHSCHALSAYEFAQWKQALYKASAYGYYFAVAVATRSIALKDVLKALPQDELEALKTTPAIDLVNDEEVDVSMKSPILATFLRENTEIIADVYEEHFQKLMKILNTH